MFHARLAARRGSSTWPTWPAGVHDKLVHRHPHVFGDVEADGADEVVANWEAIKKTEKGRRSVTEGIPAALPALMLTTKLARKARSVGLEPAGAGDAGRPRGWRRSSGWPGAASWRSRIPTTRWPATTDAAPQVGELLFAVANLAPTPRGRSPNRRCATVHWRSATAIRRGRRRPRPGDGQPLVLCPGVPPGTGTQGVMS